ncbi:hypothetical protein [Oscillatoria sp. HE19RPO]|uniref:hypothetical protein n=1 Tax=Oscillatoria sp. HE19RPO TaxID=2954806 RepID=UPI0020C37F9E|nr:hypothetical protein [Oscillatoria sp. HE19RPO]
MSKLPSPKDPQGALWVRTLDYLLLLALVAGAIASGVSIFSKSDWLVRSDRTAIGGDRLFRP